MKLVAVLEIVGATLAPLVLVRVCESAVRPANPVGRLSVTTASNAVVVPALVSTTLKLTTSPASRLVIGEVTDLTMVNTGSPTVIDFVSVMVVVPVPPGVLKFRSALLLRVCPF